MTRQYIRIGAGAGFGGDRLDAAEVLVERGGIDYLVFECLAERTLALYQQEKLKNPKAGYNPQLKRRLARVLPGCREKGIKIVSNLGGANPLGALQAVLELARELGLKGLKAAAVLGDDVQAELLEWGGVVLETGDPVSAYAERMVAAHAYLGCGPLVEALQQGAEVIVAGRVADPSLFLAPMVYEFGWREDDYTLLGQGTVVGHLLECAGQVTGGYFADPGYKDVPELWDLGFPVAEVYPDGRAIITKPSGSGGTVSLATCKEQLLYEIHDPAAYFTPDCVADFSEVRMEQLGPDRVLVEGGKGRERPATLKVNIGYRHSFVGEGEISYGGPGAVERARLAAEVLRRRLARLAPGLLELRFELIGVDSLHGEWIASGRGVPYEVRLRVAGRAASCEEAQVIGEEVEALWTNGPAGGGGARWTVREVIAVVSTLVPREKVKTRVVVEVA